MGLIKKATRMNLFLSWKNTELSRLGIVRNKILRRCGFFQLCETSSFAVILYRLWRLTKPGSFLSRTIFILSLFLPTPANTCLNLRVINLASAVKSG